jgi:hypothetical protein
MRHRLQFLLGAIALASLSTIAMAQTQPAVPPAPQGGAAEHPPIPTLHCEFPTAHSCAREGQCKPGDSAGSKLPLKVTVDFENSVVASTDESGFARADKIDSIASSSGQLVMHGIDGPFSWQLLIHDESEIASLTFATSDATISAFGSCKQR